MADACPARRAASSASAYDQPSPLQKNFSISHAKKSEASAVRQRLTTELFRPPAHNCSCRTLSDFVMAGMAQQTHICDVQESFRSITRRDDVINNRRLVDQPAILTNEITRQTKLIRGAPPLARRIPAIRLGPLPIVLTLSGARPFDRCWQVLIAVSARHQRPTPWMCAWARRGGRHYDGPPSRSNN